MSLARLIPRLESVDMAEKTLESLESRAKTISEWADKLEKKRADSRMAFFSRVCSILLLLSLTMAFISNTANQNPNTLSVVCAITFIVSLELTIVSNFVFFMRDTKVLREEMQLVQIWFAKWTGNKNMFLYGESAPASVLLNLPFSEKPLAGVLFVSDIPDIENRIINLYAGDIVVRSFHRCQMFEATLDLLLSLVVALLMIIGCLI